MSFIQNVFFEYIIIIRICFKFLKTIQHYTVPRSAMTSAKCSVYVSHANSVFHLILNCVTVLVRKINIFRMSFVMVPAQESICLTDRPLGKKNFDTFFNLKNSLPF